MLRIYLVLVVFLLAATAAMAETAQRSITIQSESEVFARMGEVVVTQADFDAFYERRRVEDIPAAVRSTNSVERVLDILLSDRLVAADAIKSGLLEDESIQAGLLDEAYFYLARQQLQRYLSQHELDDYGQHAREVWLTMDSKPTEPARYDFTHLLVSRHNRSDAEAARIAIDIAGRLESGASFSELIGQFSEDPSVSDNQGRFQGIVLESLEPEVAAALGRLEQPGEFSEPVLTGYGWHIIRLDQLHEGRELGFEEAQSQLEAVARSRHLERLRESYIRDLSEDSLQIADGALRKLRERYGVRAASPEESN